MCCGQCDVRCDSAVWPSSEKRPRGARSMRVSRERGGSLLSGSGRYSRAICLPKSLFAVAIRRSEQLCRAIANVDAKSECTIRSASHSASTFLVCISPLRLIRYVDFSASSCRSAASSNGQLATFSGCSPLESSDWMFTAGVFSML